MGLFETKSTSYDDLVKQYDNFMAPAMTITVDGTDTRKIKGVHISQATVNLSLEQVCSASFTLEQVYDLEARSVQSDIENKFQLGSIVTVALGYGSETTTVFWGYIHELQYSYDDAVSITVTALDVRRLMMMNKENRTFIEKSYSDIFKEIMKKYDDAYDSLKVEESGEKIDEMTQQGVSDYDFVAKELCRKDDKEFFVLSGNVYYRTKSSDTSPVLTLTWGANLFSFQMRRCYHDEEIAVYGLQEKELVAGREKVTTEGKMKKLSDKPFKNEMISPKAKDQKSVDAIASQEAEKNRKKSRYGSGSCIGIPQLVPGRCLAIEKLGLDPKVIKSVITEVRHSFGADGFTTEFELGG